MTLDDTETLPISVRKILLFLRRRKKLIINLNPISLEVYLKILHSINRFIQYFTIILFNKLK